MSERKKLYLDCDGVILPSCAYTSELIDVEGDFIRVDDAPMGWDRDVLRVRGMDDRLLIIKSWRPHTMLSGIKFLKKSPQFKDHHPGGWVGLASDGWKPLPPGGIQESAWRRGWASNNSMKRKESQAKSRKPRCGY